MDFDTQTPTRSPLHDQKPGMPGQDPATVPLIPSRGLHAPGRYRHSPDQGGKLGGMPEMPEMPAIATALATSPPYRLIARRVLLPWVLQGQQPAGEGLEIGAGSGAMTAGLLAAFPRLRMVATDCDAAMVTAAQQALAPFGDRASVQRADAADLPFEDSRFGFILSAAMLHHVVAWEKALAEAVRVLRPGGLLIGYDLLDSTPVRLLHFGGGHDTRLLRPGQLEAELGPASRHQDPHQAQHRQTDRQVRRQQSRINAAPPQDLTGYNPADRPSSAKTKAQVVSPSLLKSLVLTCSPDRAYGRRHETPVTH